MASSPHSSVANPAPDNKPAKLAAIYARVSSAEQKKNFSIETQTRLCLELAEREGYHVPHDYIFQDPGYSGVILERPALTRLRALVKTRTVRAVIVQDSDRLSRKSWHAGMLREELQTHGVRLVSCNQPLPPELDDSPEGALIAGQKSQMDQFFRENLTRNMSRGRYTRARKGLPSGGTLPFGYRRIREPHGGRLAPDLDEAAVVEQIFRWCADERLSIRRIAQRLTAQAVPSRQDRLPPKTHDANSDDARQPPRRGGRKTSPPGTWHTNTVRRILRNPLYQGTAYYGMTRRMGDVLIPQPQDVWVMIQVPAIVSPELFTRAQAQIQANIIESWTRGQRKYTYFLIVPGARLFVCACGRTMGGFTSNRPTTLRYRCTSHADSTGRVKTPCRGSIRTEPLDALVWEKVCAALKDPSRLVTYLAQQFGDAQTRTNAVYAKLAYLDKQTAGIDQKIARWNSAYAASIIDVVELREHRFALNQERVSLQKAHQETRDELSVALEQLNQLDRVNELIYQVCERFIDGRVVDVDQEWSGILASEQNAIETRLAGLSMSDRQQLLIALGTTVTWSPDRRGEPLERQVSVTIALDTTSGQGTAETPF